TGLIELPRNRYFGGIEPRQSPPTPRSPPWKGGGFYRSARPRRAAASLVDLGLDELRQLPQRFLPAQITGLGRDHVRYAGLLDAHLGAAGHGLEGDRDRHLAGQIGIVEAIGVDQPLARHELEIFAAEAVRMPGGEVAERHAVLAADPGIELMDRTEKAERRK